MKKVDNHSELNNAFSVGPMIIFTLMVFFNFLSRGLFAPLLPIIEEEFAISHAAAGSLFLIMSVGFSGMMILSGFPAKLLTHRGMIIFYELFLGGALFLCALSNSFRFFQFSVFLVGVSAGLYAPSGLASITSYIKKDHWGKAMGIHELGPSLGLLCAPLVIGFGTVIFPWRTVVVFIAAANWVGAALYTVWGKGGRFPGEPPHFENLKPIIKNRSIWIIVVFFILSASASIGVYSILPTYLISEKGINPQVVNSVVGAARITGLVFIFFSGVLADKLGIKVLFLIVFLFSGALGILLGVLNGTWLLIAVFFQPMIVSSFFPIGNSAISLLTAPKTRSIAFSLIIPFANAFGAGITPTFLGALAEAGRFSLGFIILGTITVCSVLFIPLLAIPKKG